MNRRSILATLLLVLSACTSSVVGPKPDVVLKPPVQCPQSIQEEQWYTLSDECRGPLGLQLAGEAAEADDWEAALEWANLSRAWLDRDLQPEGMFQAAEARYALGETRGVEAELREALKGGISRSHAALAYYYLAESALVRGSARETMSNLFSALRIDSTADWRLSADAMLGSLARSEADLRLDDFTVPPELETWRRFVEADRAYRTGSWDAARIAFQALADDEALARYGLRSIVDARIDELRERATPVADRIGVVLPFTGRAAAAGHFALRGLLVSLNPFTQPNLDLRLADNRGEPQRTQHALREFDQQGAVAVAGPLLGKNAAAAVPLANRLGLPTVVLANAELPALNPFTVRVALTPEEQVDTLLDEAAGKRGFRRFAVLYPDDAYGRTMRDAFWDAVVRRGGQITGVQSYTPGSTDFRASIRALIGADAFTSKEVEERKAKNQPLAHLDFDAVFIPDAARTAGLVVPQLLYYDVRGPLFLGTSAWNHPQLVQLARDYADGSIFVDWYVANAENAVVREFLERYAAVFPGQQPISLSAQAYEAGRILQRTAGTSSRDEARRRLYDARLNGFSGPAQVREDGEIERPLYLLTVINRRIEPFERE